ncbi:MAG: transglutaminase domain-containing protein [Polyangiales bacterium]
MRKAVALSAALALALYGCSARVAAPRPTTRTATTRAAVATSAQLVGGETALRGAAPSNVPTMPPLAVEVMSPSVRTLGEARFELVFSDGRSRPIEAVRDGADRTAPTAQHHAASFIVDYDREPLHSRCESAADERSADAILRRVDQWITHKSLAIGFVTADVVFEGREGDCTEHSVLATAMLRCNGTASRLAFGFLVFRNGTYVGASGHMWSERFEDGWRVADATFPTRAAEVVHLRLGLMLDEGPGAVALADDRDFLRVTRIRVLAR